MTQFLRPVLLADTSKVDVDVFPQECPICHHKIEPTNLYARRIVRGEDSSMDIDVLFLCPNMRCLYTFIGRYRQPKGSKLAISYAVEPKRPEAYVAPDEVAAISPSFVEIATQAKAAEAYGLDQIAGVGYRKALEFLIKDYCIARRPEDKVSIEKTLLGPCITKYVSDANVKACAARATWLGNDETHYQRRWEGKDINDLKQLTKLTVNWIANEELTQRYLAEMDDGKAPTP